MTTKEVLEQARALIERGWTQGTAARNANGDHVAATSRHACMWCATGALYVVYERIPEWRDDPKTNQVADLLRSAIPKGSNDYHQTIVGFNDAIETTKADILSIFDKAIARCDDDC